VQHAPPPAAPPPFPLRLLTMLKLMRGTYASCCSAMTGPVLPAVMPRTREKAEPPAHSTVRGTEATAGPAPPSTLCASLSPSRV
jgi:hypothetical protein